MAIYMTGDEKSRFRVNFDSHESVNLDSHESVNLDSHESVTFHFYPEICNVFCILRLSKVHVIRCSERLSTRKHVN